MDGPLPASAVNDSTRAARYAVLALASNGVLQVAWLVLRFVFPVGGSARLASMEGADQVNRVDHALWTLHWPLRLAGAVLFFMWVSKSFKTAESLGARPVGHTASSVILGFFTPIANLIQPYRGLRALDDAIDPTSLPQPPPRPAATDDIRGYREAAGAPEAPRVAARPPPLLAWWVLWLFGMIASLWGVALFDSQVGVAVVYTLSSLGQAICAGLAILVVRRIDARLRERARRLGLLDPQG